MSSKVATILRSSIEMDNIINKLSGLRECEQALEVAVNQYLPSHVLQTTRKSLDDQLVGDRSTEASVSKVLEAVNEREALQILNWISTSPYGDFHERVKQVRSPGTCEWILSNHEYIRWRETRESAILWLHGIRKPPHLMSD